MSAYAGIIIGAAVFVVAFLFIVCWLIDKWEQSRRELGEFDEYFRETPEAQARKVTGDAMDTPKVITMCRRANHAKRR